MPPYSAAQKQQIAQFVNFTQAKDSVATKVALLSSFLASLVHLWVLGANGKSYHVV
ncbi:uncharacterized protein BJX67DRAFT_361165 [Aspergillus lucknowensis]|uniref:Uncharacterized protein n=1 Tax=Aspergillus lucknowensis TaxID=176173 RepID=A0ABR4LJ07_9EURO